MNRAEKRAVAAAIEQIDAAVLVALWTGDGKIRIAVAVEIGDRHGARIEYANGQKGRKRPVAAPQPDTGGVVPWSNRHHVRNAVVIEIADGKGAGGVLRPLSQAERDRIRAEQPPALQGLDKCNGWIARETVRD
jgi:hypothetical protein